MKKIHVKLDSGVYDIHIHNSFSMLKTSLIFIRKGAKAVVITDDTVSKLYLNDVTNVLSMENYEIFTYEIPQGECSKSISVIQDIYDFLLRNHIDRTDMIIALGGGVVGDVAGYAASTYLRGIFFVQIPTTLLAQVDSSVGGKVGINYNGIKNVIGCFYQPNLVYINVQTLKSLPERQIRCGLAEIIVHGIIADPQMISFVEDKLERIKDIDSDIMQHLIYQNCLIKLKIVKKDEKDKGIRKILNFGHTVGHAVESYCEYEYLHGECVAIGIISAFKLAVSYNMIAVSDFERVKKLLIRVGLPVQLDRIDINEVQKRVAHDKKVIGDRVLFVLPVRIGKVILKELRLNNELLFSVLNDLSLSKQ